MDPTTPEHGQVLPAFARSINILTALTGLVASGVVGLCMIMLGIAFCWLGAPVLLAVVTIMLLYWGCGSYGAAFTRYERFDWRRILLQICILGITLAGFIGFYRNTHPLKPDNPAWHAQAATIVLVFFSFTLVVHLYSVMALFRFRRKILQPQSTQ